MRLYSPNEAAEKSGGTFHADYPLRAWNVFSGIMAHREMCGELCSMRFTWMTPKRFGVQPDALVWHLDLGRELAGTPLEKVFVNSGNGVTYALARYQGEIAAEIEIHENLPDSTEEIHFIKANFTNGIVTNQPLAGHFNCEGELFADDQQQQKLFLENHSDSGDGGFLDHCRKIQAMMIENGDWPRGALHSAELLRVCKETQP